MANNGVSFEDTTPDYLSGVDVTGLSETGNFILSFWLKPDSGTTLWDYIVSWANNRFDAVLKDASGGQCRLEIVTRDASATIDCAFRTDRVINFDEWNHILCSVDLAPATPELYVYVNDVEAEDEAWPSRTLTSGGVIDWNGSGGATVEIGRDHGASDHILGALQEVYLENANALDFSVEANRRKFITSGGAPADLGSDGSTPTGTQPIIYLKDDNTSFETNYGSLGNFTENGTLTDEGTVPRVPGFVVPGSLGLVGVGI